MFGTATKKALPIPVVLALILIFFCVGVAADQTWTQAEAAPQNAVTLGVSTAVALKILGTPEKITYDADVQTWFYRSPDKSVRKRCMMNQGVVVRVF